jgi:protein-disulfide isomerase
MKRALLLLTAGVALVAAGAAPKWASHVTRTSAGAYMLGNPAAKVKLVEYISYTCGHCAHFVRDATAPLKAGYVSGGRVSVEFRNAVRDQFDLVAALAARCGGAAKFHGNTEVILAAQPAWLGRAQQFAQSGGKQVEGKTPDQSMQIVARALGFDALLKPRGITPAMLNACIANKAEQKAVIDMTNQAFQTDKIHATPSFKVNGALLDNEHDWAGLEPKLKAALAAK